MQIQSHILTNKHGAWVSLSNLGAGITGIAVPDRQGRRANVTLAYAQMESYINDGACLGKTVGRFANRIAKGRFSLSGDPKVYQLACNNGPNHLHGGSKGFSEVFWDMNVRGNSVVFTYTSPNREEGYPGNLEAKVVYIWDDECRLQMDFYAITDAPTIINLTNHSYFNLEGEGKGSILDHCLQLNASCYLPVDEDLIPTGRLASVQGTPMDFRKAKPIGLDIALPDEQLLRGHGYDHCWAIDGPASVGATTDMGTPLLRVAACLMAPHSGRALSISTTQPGIQVYTGNFLSGAGLNSMGTPHVNRGGVALECQAFPDSPNQPAFPSVLLLPNQKYYQQINYQFFVQ